MLGHAEVFVLDDRVAIRFEKWLVVVAGLAFIVKVPTTTDVS
jgi:hypothetical protein